ncbi:MAG TPA: chemotaxis protein CheD [Chloroflexota bacterium]|nr:chemotaxis protein CheD [Chloroflexota bacterium]
MAVVVSTGPSTLASPAGNPTMVGLGEVRVINGTTLPDETLVAYGLGSCVAICLFDAGSHVAGMAHVVLPGADPSGAPNGKYARSALPAMIARMQSEGAGDPRRYVARLAGGAQILRLGGSGTLPRIGDQNALAVQEALKSNGIALKGADLGGSKGRSVWFNPGEGGQIRVRTVGSAERCL